MNSIDEETLFQSYKEAGGLENRFMKKKSINLYTALEDLDFHWDYEQVKEFKQMWNKGFSIMYIAEYFDRPQEEVAVLLLDRSLKGCIKQRKGGLFGERA